MLEAPNSQETRGLLVHATSDFQDNNKDKWIADGIMPTEVIKFYSFLS